MDQKKVKTETGGQPGHIHYGSIEEQMRLRATSADKSVKREVEVDAAPEMEILPLSQTQMSTHSAQQSLIEDLELRKKASEIVVPTVDEKVKDRLREIGEPIILFGETRGARRQRLRLALASQGLTQGMPSDYMEVGATDGMEGGEDGEEVRRRPFQTDGSGALKTARLEILNDSLSRASTRLQHLHLRDNNLANESDSTWAARNAYEESNLYNALKEVLPSISVVGDPRPLTSISFNHDGSLVASSSWNTVCRLWNVQKGQEVQVLKGHTERVIDISFAPNNLSSNPDSMDTDTHTDNGSRVLGLASSGTDQTIQLWSVNASTPLATLQGHEDRVNILGWHPTGKWLFASSHDCTWSLWDLNTQKQLLKQDGHSRAVFGLSVHPDGALVATGSVDASVRVWDVRSGLSIASFPGHVRQVLGVDWHADGVLLATASEDHSVRIWDMRMRKNVYTIAAHSALVSDVKFAPHHSKYLVTSGYDNVARIWKTEDWSLLCTLSGHDSRVTALDISPVEAPKAPHNTEFGDFPEVTIATAGYDRTWKLWKPTSF